MASRRNETEEENITAKKAINLRVGIDLGSTMFRAVAAIQNENGQLQIIKCEKQASSGIKRGAIQNINDVAFGINSLCKKLENSVTNIVNEGKEKEELVKVHIDKVYVSLNGHMKTEDNQVPLRGNNTIITQEMVDTLNQKNRMQTSNDADMEILQVLTQEYLVDDDPIDGNPVGCQFDMLMARYKNIWGNKKLKQNVRQTLQESNRELAGYTVAPIATANVMLSDNEKELGSMLVDFGATSTNVVIYSKKKMRFAFVIPFGSDFITTNIAGLKIVKEEAEKLKTKCTCKPKDSKSRAVFQLPLSGKEIDYKIVCDVIERCTDKLIGYIVECIKESKMAVGVEIESMVIAGKGAQLKGLKEKLEEKTGLSVHMGSIYRGKFAEETDETIFKDGEYAQAMGALLDSTESCAYSEAAFKPEARKTNKSKSFFGTLKQFSISLFDGEVPN